MSRTQDKKLPRDNKNNAGPVTKKKGKKNPAGVADDTRVIYAEESNPDD